MKYRTRLTTEQAAFLDLKPKKKDKDGRASRYSLTTEQRELLGFPPISNKREFVETVRKLDKHGNPTGSIEKLQSEPIDVPNNFELIKVSVNESTGQQWLQYKPKNVEAEQAEALQDIHTRMIEEMKAYAPKYPKIKRNKIKDGHCLVFDPADIHIGKICSSFATGETYNSQIAVQRVRQGLKGILQKANGFNIDKIIFIAGNDILHVDNNKSTTTGGTPQDTDGMWHDNYILAKQLLVEIIETLMTIADVEVVFNPSNHDFTHGFMLLDSIASWFHNANQVTFDNDMRYRKYTVYGKNLIGSTHMDKVKPHMLHGLMTEEASEHWHACPHRYFYGHHVHHKTSKDVFSVCIETLRSPSGTDMWHHISGYQHAPQAVEAFIHHPEQGQVARLVEIF